MKQKVKEIDEDLGIIDKILLSAGEPPNKPFWVSIRKKDSCLFSRRNGYRGKLILGYSVCIRLFGIDITKNY